MSTWDDKPNDYEHALAEINRLRKALERTRPHIRDEIIEECAQVLEEYWVDLDKSPKLKELTAAIRALKDRP